MKRVIIELKVRAGSDMKAILGAPAAKVLGFRIDERYRPVPIEPTHGTLAEGEEVVLVRGDLDESCEEALRATPEVLGVWNDAHVEPIGF